MNFVVALVTFNWGPLKGDGVIMAEVGECHGHILDGEFRIMINDVQPNSTKHPKYPYVIEKGSIPREYCEPH